MEDWTVTEVYYYTVPMVDSYSVTVVISQDQLCQVVSMILYTQYTTVYHKSVQVVKESR